MSVTNITSTATVGSNSQTLLANAARTKISKQIVMLAKYDLRFYDLCDYKETIGQGNSKTVRFNIFPDFNLPTATLTEGADPAGSTLSSSYVEAVAEQWGDVCAITDVAELTLAHPIMNVVQERLARQAARTIDREIQSVLKAGTNVYFSDATDPQTNAARSDLGTSDVIRVADLKKAVSYLRIQGAQPMDGEHYVGVLHPAAEADLNTFDNFILAKAYAGDATPLFMGEIGKFLGVRWIRSNFMPVYVNNTTVSLAITSKASASGGSLSNSTTYYFKVVAKEVATGFERIIFAEDSQATAAGGTAITVTMPSSTSYVYDLYFGSSSGACYKHSSNNAASAAVTVLSVPAAAAGSAPVTPANSVHVITSYVFGKGAYAIVDLQNLQFFITPDQSLPGNVLRLVRYAGWKVMLKSVILKNEFFVQIESHSGFAP